MEETEWSPRLWTIPRSPEIIKKEHGGAGKDTEGFAEKVPEDRAVLLHSRGLCAPRVLVTSDNTGP